MGSNIIELAKLGHERAAELKGSYEAINACSVAQLISDLSTQLEVQFVRSTNMAVQLANAESKCRELAADDEKVMESLKQADAAVKLAHEKYSAIAAENVALAAENKKAFDAVTVFSNVTHDITEIICDELGRDRVAEIVSAYNDLSNMPATDAFLAELRAQGVEMFAHDVGESEQGNGLMKAIGRRATKFAAQLRKGAAL